jgi:hypothetical protein
MGRVVIHLNIDQDIPTGEVGEQMIDRYIDLLAETDGELTWCEVGVDFYEDERPDGSLKPIDLETGERLE